VSITTISTDNTVATLCVDTLAVFHYGDTRDEAGRRVEECSKLMHIPHINVAAAGRGSYYVFFNACISLYGARDFDDAVEVLDATLPGVVERISAHENAAGVAPEHCHLGAAGFQEIVVVGWSALRSRMAAFVFTKEPNQDFSKVEVDGIRAVPATEPLLQQFRSENPRGWRPKTDADFARLARMQVESCRQLLGPLHLFKDACGGRLLRATLTRDSFACREVCELE
jgi:hypothetical protein